MTDPAAPPAPADPTGPGEPLALFPLHLPLLPGGLLALRVFEARYLDLVARCLRDGHGFGVIGLRQGAEVRQAGETVELDPTGCLAEILECDAGTPGLLQLRCLGQRRFDLAEPPRAQANGLWVAPVRWRAPETVVAIPPALQHTARMLQDAQSQLAARGLELHQAPARLDDAGWVAARWCELLDTSGSRRRQLLQTDDPLERLRLVDAWLGQATAPGDRASTGRRGPLH